MVEITLHKASTLFPHTYIPLSLHQLDQSRLTLAKFIISNMSVGNGQTWRVMQYFFLWPQYQ